MWHVSCSAPRALGSGSPRGYELIVSFLANATPRPKGVKPLVNASVCGKGRPARWSYRPRSGKRAAKFRAGRGGAGDMGGKERSAHNRHAAGAAKRTRYERSTTSNKSRSNFTVDPRETKRDGRQSPGVSPGASSSLGRRTATLPCWLEDHAEITPILARSARLLGRRQNCWT